MDEFDVAVVVFCRAQGADEQDAANRAEGMTRQVLRDAEFMVVQPRPGQTVHAVATIPLGQALSGYITARPNARAYKLAGLGEPQKENADG